VVEATSRLCFVIAPFGGRFDDVYRNLIGPVVIGQGLTPLRADEISNPGFIMEQIRTAIQQARICVADVTGSNPNVLYEIGLAHSGNKPLILIAERGSKVPFDVAHERVIFYEEQLESAEEPLRKAISFALAGTLSRASELLAIGMNTGAIAAAAVVLEQRLICLLQSKSAIRSNRSSIGQMLRLLKEHKIVPASRISRLTKVAALRNRSVHASDEPEPTRRTRNSSLKRYVRFLTALKR
jgi:uncharacterized protein YutE (UPF0331/DUF86 family)